MNFERLLPSELRFDDCMSHDMEMLAGEIEELRAQMLSQHYVDKPGAVRDTAQTHMSVYRAAVFAYQVAVFIGGTDLRPPMVTYLCEVSQRPNPKSAFAHDVHEYLSENPYVDAFIGRYAEDIDEMRSQLTAIELTAGMVFMLCERQRGEQYMHGEFDSLQPSSFE